MDWTILAGALIGGLVSFTLARLFFRARNRRAERRDIHAIWCEQQVQELVPNIDWPEGRDVNYQTVATRTLELSEFVVYLRMFQVVHATDPAMVAAIQKRCEEIRSVDRWLIDLMKALWKEEVKTRGLE